MKKVIATLLVFVFVLSLVACGNEEKIREERIQVNNELQGTWYLYENSSYGKLTYMVSFGYGSYSFSTYPYDSASPLYQEGGNYSIDVNKHEILCTSENGLTRSFTYQNDSGYLSISSDIGKYTKYIE